MNVRKAVIPIAGRGTRQLPASWAVPKALMPVLDRDGLAKPIIHLLMREAFSAGIEHVALIVSPGQASHIQGYFKKFDEALLTSVINKPHLRQISDELDQWGQRIEYIEQTTPEGFGHAVWCSRDWVAGEPFLLMLGDYVFVSNQQRSCASQLVDVFNRMSPAAVTGMSICDAATLPRVGVMHGSPVEGEVGLYRAQRIVEKPSLDLARRELTTPGLPPGCWLAHFGTYVFSRAIFDVLDDFVQNNIRQQGEIQMTDAQERLRSTGAPYYGLVIDGMAYDAGISDGWFAAQQAMTTRG
jgi:UTP--glucose-1-phosphate uridylyltransferase